MMNDRAHFSQYLCSANSAPGEGALARRAVPPPQTGPRQETSLYYEIGAWFHPRRDGARSVT